MMDLATALEWIGNWPERGSFDIFRQTLDPGWIEWALQRTGTATVRRRKLPAERVVWIVIGMALLRDRSIQEVVSHLHLAWDRGAPLLPQTPPSGGAVVRARDRLGAEPMRKLFNLSGQHWSAQMSESAGWKGLRLFAVDGSHLRVPDSPENAEFFGVPKSGRSAGAYPQLRMVFAVDAIARILVDAEIGPWKCSEKQIAGPVLHRIADNSLTILDRNYIDYGLFYRLRAAGRNRHWLVRAKSNLRWRTVRRLGPDDELVELTLTRQSRKADPCLPKTMIARAVRYQRRGFRPKVLLTSLLDPVEYPADAVVLLYHERWEVEIGFDEAKTHALERQEAHLRSQSPERILQEAWGLLVAYNLIRVEMAAVAIEQGVPPRRISFRHAIMLIRNAWLSAWLMKPAHLPAMLGTLRAEMALLVLPKRRDRSCPREAKIKMSNYPKKRRIHHVNG